jgi:hypothetical protein
MQFRQTILAMSMSSAIATLTACGGGGGGSGGSPYSSGNPYLRSEVPYATPVRVATIDPLVNVSNTGGKYAVSDTFTADITGTGGQDLIIAGRMTQPTSVPEWGDNRISLLAWEGGRLVDKTAQWFPDNTNVILGTEPSVKFADFFKTGRNDMFVAPSTDMTHYGPGYVYRNTGSSFSRQTLTTDNIWAHDSAIADLDGDTYKDIVLLDMNRDNTTFAINDRVSGFTLYKADPASRFGGGSIAVADFLNNGTTTLITTDNGTSEGNRARLYAWNFTPGVANQISFTELATLPTPRFQLPKWQALGITSSHDVRTLAHDFNDDSIVDAIIFSRPGNTLANYSEVQFLKNNGGGNFADVTDTTLVGYNTSTSVTYNPRVLDLNGDGRLDILVNGVDFSGANNSTQFLLKSSDGKYVAAYQNILTDFATQVNTIQGTPNSGNTVDLLKGPDGKLYLISTVSFMNGTDRQLAVYMSELGSQRTTTAKTAVELIQQKWPYMTVAQANDALARTSATYFGGRIIDIEAALSPVGSLSIPNARGTVPISGYISGISLDSGQAIVMDELKRSFSVNLQGMNVARMNAFQMNMEHNDQHNLTSHAEYLVKGPVMTYNGIRIGSESRNNFTLNGGADGPTTTNQTFTNYTVGMPKIWSKGNFTFGTQYTALNQNPWLSMGGAWGTINNSNILDNVVTYRNGGFTTQASFMHVTTNITPGLVTRVSNMTGGWAETGYRYNDIKGIGDIGVYAGIKPVVFSGSVDAKIPTAVDNAGNVVYTNKNMAIQNQTTPYIRAMYTNLIDKNTQFRVSGMVLSTGQYRIMNEFRWWLN